MQGCIVNYRPQRSCEGYVFTSVYLSTWGGGYLTRYPPGPGTPPWDQVHPRTRYTTPGPGTPHPPDQVHPWDQVHPPRDQVHPPRTRYTPPGPGTPRTRYTPPPRDTATAADGTHPTGMHSCCERVSQLEIRFRLTGQRPNKQNLCTSYRVYSFFFHNREICKI